MIWRWIFNWCRISKRLIYRSLNNDSSFNCWAKGGFFDLVNDIFRVFDGVLTRAWHIFSNERIISPGFGNQTWQWFITETMILWWGFKLLSSESYLFLLLWVFSKDVGEVLFHLLFEVRLTVAFLLWERLDWRLF